MSSIARLMRRGALVAAIVAPELAATAAQSAEHSAGTAPADEALQPDQPGIAPPGMMDEGMMSHGMRQTGADAVMPRMRMRRHMMKIIFAVADTNGDGGLSFDEITTIQKRIFDQVDDNKDGKVTPEEVQSFMHE
jgi:hypothetical protein